jgi:glycosyltransferase involved in cell wall biosynthesis
MLTSFGYHDSGGGTIVPRHVAKELARRGWDVSVFHAAVGGIDNPEPHAVRTWDDDGVRLIGVFNRPHGLFDLGNPRREIDDPPITRAFAAALDEHRPQVVHFHNLHNLGAALIDESAARGIPSYFSTHNYWLACPRAYLYRQDLELCHGPADGGAACAACVGSSDTTGHQERLTEIRSRFERGVNVCLAVSEAVKRTLLSAGYPEAMVDVVRQAMPQEQQIWDALGRDRRPGRVGRRLTVGFFGSAYPHKGPSVLVAATGLMQHDVAVKIHGEVPESFGQHLRALDRTGRVEICGAFSHDRLPELLAGVDVAVIPSLWWDCAPLMVAECLAGRVPVLASRMGGIAESVRDDVDGMLVDGRDAPALAAALDRLAGEPGLLERLQAAIDPPRAFTDYVDELERYYAGERPSQSPGRRLPVSVSWRGDQGRPTSLAVINTNVCDGLEGEGFAVERLLRDGSTMTPTAPFAAEVTVRHQWPPDFSAASGRLAVIQPWEFGSIPRSWVAPIQRNVDELWVPSGYVKRMFVQDGIDGERIRVIGNGVDLERFTPEGPRMELGAPDDCRFLFVGGMVARKAPDLLIAAYLEAFAGRDDVCLVIKDFGAGSIYPGSDRGPVKEHADQARLPRIVYLDEDLTDDEMASLYRACDVTALPYRGEGFCMPALEGMACGLPAIVTAGGPTDEFVPDQACWRVPAGVKRATEQRVDGMDTAGFPYSLDPDPAALRRIMLEVADDAAERAVRGAAGRAAAESHGWDGVARRYAERITALAALPPRHARPAGQPFELDPPAPAALLATPAWLGNDRLADLLYAWVQSTAPGEPACLYLLADPRVHGDQAACTEHVLQAAAARGANLDAGADVTILMQPLRDDTAARIHRASTGYAPLHAACEGHLRLAAAAGNPVVRPETDAVRVWLASVHALRAA